MDKNYCNHIGDLLETWQGGSRTYTEDQLDAIKNAFVEFQQNNDTKATSILTLGYSSGQVCPVMETSLLIQPANINS